MGIMRWLAAAAAGWATWELVRPRGPLIIGTYWTYDDLRSAARWKGMIDAGFDAVSIKINNGLSTTRANEVPGLIERLRAEGQVVHGWGWCYCTSDEVAINEARHVVMLCKRYGLTDYHWNAEHNWAGSDRPTRYAIKFADECRRLMPGIRLWGNCFSGSYATLEMAKHFDVWEPMVYGGVSASTSVWQFRKRLDKFGRKVKRSAMISGGPKWGHFYDTKKYPGILSLIKQYEPYAVSYWRPYRIIGGANNGPPLAQQVSEIRQAFNLFGNLA